ncbi:M15 family metallopeptidase [Allobaculum mucilyticum]|uniref:M15 family metallopeptidase n=1 Tax=Allobaculum mucilyticum TaxID=2834459 RepID=UPI001E2F444C|nr:D-alanyl-D-alanine carboxypeptidase family protein [Allobaculum mucilyticum]UNT95812.1 D-alanyl-D-alanine carboxypeptidase family protein [Allobaculum mucilyticum]
MKSKRVMIRTRAVIFASCIAVFALTILRMDAVSNPLTRYPYGSPEERDQLESLLDDSQIGILINMQLQPEEVLPFASVEGFDMNNIQYYNGVMDVQQADPQFIVYFVNKYRPRMSLDQMEQALEWLSYSDLIDYLETATTIPLYQGNPNEILTMLDGTQTLARWRPQVLTEIAPGIYLRFAAANAWNQLSQAAAQDGITLVPQSGFQSIEDQQAAPEYSSYPQGPYGTREEQLGMTVHLDGFDAWNTLLSQPQAVIEESSEQDDSEADSQSLQSSQPSDSAEVSQESQTTQDLNADEEENVSSQDAGPMSLEEAWESLDESQKAVIEWLRANAAQYGWIFRYPENDTQNKDMAWQPFVLRYVGIPRAMELSGDSES